MLFNVRMYAAAHKYMIGFLQDLAKNKLESQLDQLDSAKDVSPFLGIIPDIYISTLDPTLRQLLNPVLRRLRHNLASDAAFEALLKSGLGDGNFASDVFAALVCLPDPSEFYCGNCILKNSERLQCKGCGKTNKLWGRRITEYSK